jgi:hypothetical protein
VHSYRRSRAFLRGPLTHVPFLAAHERVSAGASLKKLASGQRYPMIALAVAAVTVALAPLTASAAVTNHAPTSSVNSASTSSSVKRAVAKQAGSKAGSKAAPSAEKASTDAKSSVTKPDTTKNTATAHAAPATTATHVAAAAPAVSTKPYAGVSYSSLEPTGTDGSQQEFTPDSDQWQNATSIVDAAKSMNLSAYAATIAVATAMQESSLRNLTTATNADSLGLFQQRPSMGWGTPAELTDPTYAAKAFLKELPSGYESMDLASAAQSVQASFDGSLYAQWEEQAAHMVYQIANS